MAFNLNPIINCTNFALFLLYYVLIELTHVFQSQIVLSVFLWRRQTFVFHEKLHIRNQRNFICVTQDVYFLDDLVIEHQLIFLVAVLRDELLWLIKFFRMTLALGSLQVIRLLGLLKVVEGLKILVFAVSCPRGLGHWGVYLL